MIERWKAVPEWEGLYAVSNMGRVKSLPRVSMRSNGAPQTVRERILKAPPNKDGYAEVRLTRPGCTKTYQVHVLVATAFIRKPAWADRVCHKDDTPGNNVKSNLYWGDAGTNGHDCYTNGIKKHKITLNMVERVRRMRVSGMTLQAIADRVGISKRSVLNIVNGNYRFKET